MKFNLCPFFIKFNQLKMVDGVLHLIYPETCIICDQELARTEQAFCFQCASELHFTHFETFKKPTDLDQLFWGRVQLEATYALLYYEKTNSSQALLKALKYQHRGDVGRVLGAMIGKKLLHHPKFHGIEALIPVPIHPKKEFIRGYNQSEMIASGISQILNIPIHKHFIQRVEHSKSQTQLGRFTRWDNVQGKFKLTNTTQLKHIAIVDDVITTGSTLESIIQIIQDKFPDIKISVLSLALTK